MDDIFLSSFINELEKKAKWGKFRKYIKPKSEWKKIPYEWKGKKIPKGELAMEKIPFSKYFLKEVVPGYGIAGGILGLGALGSRKLLKKKN